MSLYPTVAAPISVMISAGVTNAADVVKLYNCYSPTNPNPPPVELLRNPVLFDILLRDLFNPTKPINNAYLSKYLYLLAYAATANENDALQSYKEELNETTIALEAVYSVCQRNSFGSEFQASIDLLKSKISIPIVSMGILHWIGKNLMDTDFYQTSYNTSYIPTLLQLLRFISYFHPLQRGSVLQLLIQIFKMDTPLDPLTALEYRRNIIDNCIYLMMCGFVLPVMNEVEALAPKTDQSLIRHFVIQVVEMTEAPYSFSFLSSFLRILERPASIEALKNHEKRKHIAQFLDYCVQHVEYP
eukprot:CAMPEP_0168553454 /NCGR_PEP_ID=MMETSP0413-20121227/7259_1 /TAXON_ID=136452 /ORGANISM="Filamoeba nolandi, Strain NC-AS-23-1" /LENGTH=300 /DNA_ID=CAMNT_0008584137 /DNA_START=392 /DNA_END=1291 /DNA_ORIENTATION=-